MRCQLSSASRTQGPASVPSTWNVKVPDWSWMVIRSMIHSFPGGWVLPFKLPLARSGLKQRGGQSIETWVTFRNGLTSKHLRNARNPVLYCDVPGADEMPAEDSADADGSARTTERELTRSSGRPANLLLQGRGSSL